MRNGEAPKNTENLRKEGKGTLNKNKERENRLIRRRVFRTRKARDEEDGGGKKKR